MSDDENNLIYEDDIYSNYDSDNEWDYEKITISIFIIYLIESIITGSLIFFAIFKNYDEIKIFDNLKTNIIILSISFIFFNLLNLLVSNCCIKFSVNYVFNFILFIIIALFKIALVFLTINFFHTQIFSFKLNSYMYFIWKAGSSLYYLILILIKLCKSDIHISVFLVIGILTSGASFIFEILFRNDFTGGGMGSFLLLSEVIFLCISFTYAVAKNKFKNIRFFEKVILTDAYKYYSLFICLACVPIVLIICLILCCKSYCDCGECSGRTYYASSEKETKQGKKKENKKSYLIIKWY